MMKGHVVTSRTVSGAQCIQWRVKRERTIQHTGARLPWTVNRKSYVAHRMAAFFGNKKVPCKYACLIRFHISSSCTLCA